MDQDFRRHDEAGAARLALTYLSEHFDNVQGRLDKEMFDKLDKGMVIAPEEALQFIYMKHANQKLIRKFEATFKAGQSASQRIHPLMNGAHNNA